MHNNIREEYKQMAKKIKEEVKKEGKKELITNAKAIEDLKAQIKHFEGLLLKAQGALEILEQIENQNKD
tara:strand:+ start:3093 stop:3299 length:207 start_codon:yes stop_codon:yes gene_type:complete